MNKKIACMCAAIAMLVAVNESRAEGFDTRQFYTIAGTHGVFSVESAKTMEHLDYSVKIMGDYASVPLRFEVPAGTVVSSSQTAQIDGVLSLTLAGAIGILDFLEVGLTLPFIAYESFSDPFRTINSVRVDAPERGVTGDMQVRVKGAILQDLSGFSLGLGAIFSLPTGQEKGLVGDRSFWARPYIAMDYEIGPVEMMLNAGFTFRRKTEYLDYTSSHGFNYGFGINYHAVEDWLDVKGEIYGETPMSSKSQESNHQSAEYLLGLTVKTPIDLSIDLGAGAGIGSGVKNPEYRVLFGLTYAPNSKDSDGDGIKDRHDLCPQVPGVEEYEGCPAPDVDGDGWCDVWVTDPALAEHFGCKMTDKCPDVAGISEFEGCPNPDSDGDGVCDRWVSETEGLSFACTGIDWCPEVAGESAHDGCANPDSDGDGWCDAWITDEKIAEHFGCKMTDRCPNLPGVDDYSGCPEADGDGDGLCAPFVEELGLSDMYFCTGVDKCPEEPEDFDNFEDEDGCPDPDNDGDGICDPWVSEMGLLEKYKGICRGIDKCPDESETINGYKDDDGCPDKGRQIVFVLEDKLEIRDKIYFDNNRTTIKKKSYSLLDQVAHTILANPKITKLTVEGHTDDTGSYEHNLTLSRGRAQAVVDYLIAQGISPNRLSAIGYGPDKPIDPAKTKKARALNRRVEFVITEKK